jgi:hypothetical protein
MARIERESYASFDPLDAGARVETMAGYQREIDATEGVIGDLADQLKKAKELRETWVKKIGVILHAHLNAKAVFLLKGGEVTDEQPPEPGLYDGVEKPKPSNESPPDRRPEETTSEPQRAADCPPEIVEAINTYKDGRKTQDERKNAAGRIIGHGAGGGSFPPSIDKEELMRMARRVLSEPIERKPAAAIAAEAKTLPPLRVGKECAGTVNVIPLDTIEGLSEGMLLSCPSGEVLEIRGLKPRRKEIGVHRGAKGTTASVLKEGSLLRYLSGPEEAPLLPPSAPAPTAAATTAPAIPAAEPAKPKSHHKAKATAVATTPEL